jgi:hypothetical protein
LSSHKRVRRIFGEAGQSGHEDGIKKVSLERVLGHACTTYVHLNLVYTDFNFNGPLDFVRKAAGLSDRIK